MDAIPHNSVKEYQQGMFEEYETDKNVDEE